MEIVVDENRESRLSTGVVSALIVIGAVILLLALTETAGAQEPPAGPSAVASCVDGDVQITAMFPNVFAIEATYSATLDDDPTTTRSGTIAVDGTAEEVWGGLADGDHDVEVSYNGSVVGTLELSLDCNIGLPHEVEVDVSCLGDRGRVDVTITNVGDVSNDFTILVGAIERSATIPAGQMGGTTVTGRPNGSLIVTVTGPGFTSNAGVEILCDPIQSASITTFCANGTAQLSVTLTNPSTRSLDYTVQVSSRPDQMVTVLAGTTQSVSVPALADGEYAIFISSPGLRTRQFAPQPVYCATATPSAGAVVTTSCLAGRGRIDIWARSMQSIETTTTVSGLSPRVRTLEPGRQRPITTVTGRFDGDYAVTINGPGLSLSTTVTVDCDGAPNSDEPTVTASCLGGRGRVDALLPNPNDVPVLFRVEYPNLAPRERTVPDGTTGRITITGRIDPTATVLVYADGELALTQPLTFSC